jgi:PhzF family phenazine biosynthesis protein
MTIKLYQVDAFTSEPFRGNPAAVCLLPKPKDETWMQNVASEMNLSETAFLVQVEDGYNLRWFTPAVEVELCGHATLASAHVLYTTGLVKPDQEARFHTASGLLTANKVGEAIELNFPTTPPIEVAEPPELADALGVKPLYVGMSKYDYLVRVESEAEVRVSQPDFKKLVELDVRCVILTSPSENDDYDFISRVFAPGAGIDEDPVTGSAHCCLGPYWMKELGFDEMVAYQASERGGVLRVRVTKERVYLSGRAVTVFEGELKV